MGGEGTSPLQFQLVGVRNPERKHSKIKCPSNLFQCFIKMDQKLHRVQTVDRNPFKSGSCLKVTGPIVHSRSSKWFVSLLAVFRKRNSRGNVSHAPLLDETTVSAL